MAAPTGRRAARSWLAAGALAFAPQLAAAQVADPCRVVSMQRSEVQAVRIPAPDGRSTLSNRKDANKVDQVYLSEAGRPEICLTCTQQPGGPRPDRLKMQVHWHPSGRWIVMAVERDEYSTPPVLGWSRAFVEGELQSGLWTNIWVTTPDGTRWRRLSDFRSGGKGFADGFTGVAMSADGRHAVWSQIVDGNVFVYRPFGRWELVLADIEEGDDGLPRFVNLRDITPPGMHWNEPGNFHPDGEHLLLSGSIEKDAQGMDQYTLNIHTGELVNLTRSPTVWDEHGVFSPDGEKILFMSAAPYRDDPKASQVLSIKTDFMLMNRDGSGLQRLTHFAEPGYPEHSEKRGIAASGDWSADGRSVQLLELIFPTYRYWDVGFAGACGNARRRPVA